MSEADQQQAPEANSAAREPYTGPVPKAALSDAIQDYLKELYHLQSDGERVSVTALAREQKVSPASASEMVKKLAALGLDVEDVHDEADRLEHVLSEELEAKIDSALGYPTHDPHGDPIPNADLKWPDGS